MFCLAVGPRRLIVRPCDAGLRLRHAGLRTSGLGIRAPEFIPAALEKGPEPRSFADLPRRFPRGLRGGDRAPDGSSLGHHGRLPHGAMGRGDLSIRSTGDLRSGRPVADVPDARLQPARVPLALGHGLLPPRDRGIRQGPQPRQPPGFALARLEQVRTPALEPPPRPVRLCPDLAPGDTRLACVAGAPAMEPGDRIDARGDRDLPGEPELSGVDRRMVEPAHDY